LYIGGTSYDLNNLLVPGTLASGAFLANANAINDRGQIAVDSSDGQAYLLTPVTPPLVTPAPGTLWFVLAGLGATLLFARRRFHPGDAR
jgi:hypothetical protein